MHESSFNNFLSDGKNGFSETEGITVLSLFDGMSCGQLALQKLGIKVKQYYAAEIDKHAIQVTQHNFPNTIQLGDVTKVFAKDLPKIDLLIGGSPCQGFSFAGKQLAFDDPRSKLFFEFVRLKNECNPTYFMLENVKMKKEFELIISKYMGVAPIEINSALLSAQNRVRLYWTNIANEPFGLFGDMQCMIPQPKDKGILLRDILESNVADKYYLTDKAIDRLNKAQLIGIKAKVDPEKSGTITIKNQSGQLAIDNSTTLIVASRGRNPENPKSRESGLETEQHLEPRFDGKTNCITSVQKDNLVMQLNPSTESGGVQPYQQNRVYDIDGISPALMAQMSCGTHAILEKSPCLHGFEHGTNGQLNKQLAKGGLIRRLTETECERLQTVPDGYTGIVSSTQRYRMLGNGWTVDVIAYIFSFMAFSKPKSEGEKIIKTA
jgi:DNA (cytosine-5)-methyltransferase 3A